MDRPRAVDRRGTFRGLLLRSVGGLHAGSTPDDQKGRMIGAMNLINWIGIMISAVFYGVLIKIFSPDLLGIRESWIFAVSALVMLPIALFYRPAA